MNLRPLKKKLLVRQDPPKEKVGGLFLPRNSRDLYDDYATIIAIGPDVKVEVKVGDRVLFKRQPSSALNPDSREGKDWEGLLMLDEDNVLAVIE